VSANGSNPRLDRIERLIEQSERANKEAHARSEQAHARSEQAHARSEQAHARSEQAHARHEREMAEIRELGRKTRDDLRRWSALGVKEARSQRKRQREIDLNITRLSAAQLVTEEKLANFIAALGGSRNGGGGRTRP
jgi:hypothetical protein